MTKSNTAKGSSGTSKTGLKWAKYPGYDEGEVLHCSCCSRSFKSTTCRHIRTRCAWQKWETSGGLRRGVYHCLWSTNSWFFIKFLPLKGVDWPPIQFPMLMLFWQTTGREKYQSSRSIARFRRNLRFYLSSNQLSRGRHQCWDIWGLGERCEEQDAGTQARLDGCWGEEPEWWGEIWDCCTGSALLDSNAFPKVIYVSMRLDEIRFPRTQ